MGIERVFFDIAKKMIYKSTLYHKCLLKGRVNQVLSKAKSIRNGTREDIVLCYKCGRLFIKMSTKWWEGLVPLWVGYGANSNF